MAVLIVNVAPRHCGPPPPAQAPAAPLQASSTGRTNSLDAFILVGVGGKSFSTKTSDTLEDVLPWLFPIGQNQILHASAIKGPTLLLAP